MKSASLRFSTDILRRLGEELNPSVDHGIIELVKNAYDADARKCTVELIKTDYAGGSFQVSDDGDGMDSEEVSGGWLVIGKSRRAGQAHTRLGRVPSGSKGLGRLAALRLGKRAKLTTRPRKNSQTQYELTIDWAEFDKATLVDDVELSISARKLPGRSEAGTEIHVEDLRTRISRMDVKRLARAMVLLADPFGGDPSSFKLALNAPEYSDLENLVSNLYFEDAEYHLEATLDEEGRAKAVIRDWRGKSLWTAKHKDITTVEDSGRYECPSARFDFWAFLLNKETFSTRNSTLGEVRAWLQSYGGVHLYQNELRVNPYGNPGNDWLDINLRRAQSPEERPSTNNSIGRVALFDTQRLLLQKTDRSGFIESDAFLELKRFASDSLEWMAKNRLEEAEKRRAKARAEAPMRSRTTKDSVEEAIRSIPAADRTAVVAAFSRYESARDREVKALQKEVQLYRTLSTAGITAATFAHESTANPIKAISSTIKTIERRARKHLGSRFRAILQEPIEIIVHSIDALKVLGNITLSLVDHDKRRVGKVDLHKVIKDVIRLYSPFIDEQGVEIHLELTKGKPYLRGSEAATESIIANFLNNSLMWFEGQVRKKPMVLIRTELQGEIFRLEFLDNGPGIRDIDPRFIWLPGQTTRPNGTGLGLAIVRDAVKDLGGSVGVIEKGDLGGATFWVELPILGA